MTSKSENKKKENKDKAQTKHFNLGRGMVRIVALILALIMLLATSGTLIYYLMIQ